MNMILSFVAPVMFTAFGFVAAVASGACRDLEDVAPITPLAAMLVALMLFIIQAVLWTRFGVKLGGA